MAERIYTSASELALKMRRRAKALSKEMLRVHEETAKEMLVVAIELSSARAYSPLIDKTRPYSVRNPHPPIEPYFVNIQTGLFLKSWKLRTTKAGLITSEIFNVAPYAAFFGGLPTRKMIGRPILQEVTKRVRKKRKLAAAKAKSEALEKT